jgi:hypothetical protein
VIDTAKELDALLLEQSFQTRNDFVDRMTAGTGLNPFGHG